MLCKNVQSLCHYFPHDPDLKRLQQLFVSKNPFRNVPSNVPLNVKCSLAVIRKISDNTNLFGYNISKYSRIICFRSKDTWLWKETYYVFIPKTEI